MGFLKSKFSSYCIGMIIGVISTMLLYNISFEASINDTYKEYEKVVSKEIKRDEFILENKNYIVAGLLLNDKLKEDIVKDLGGKEKFEKYYKLDIEPIYRSHLKDLFESFFKNFDSSKLSKLLYNVTQKVSNFILSNLDKIKEFIMNIIDTNKDIIGKFVKNIIIKNKDSIEKLINEKKDQIINLIKQIIIKILPNISQKTREEIIKFIDQNKDNLIDAVKDLSDEIKQKIADYLNENKEQIIKELINSIMDFIFENKEIIIKELMNYLSEHKQEIIDFIVAFLKESDLYNKILALLENTDDDYNFSTIEVGEQIIDLSFLNILDIEIADAQYDNNSTPLNLKDDTLKISKIHINFESLDSKGIDILTGHIDITGVKAKIFYSLIGDFNAFI